MEKHKFVSKEERYNAILKYLTIIYNRSETPTSSNIISHCDEMRLNRKGELVESALSQTFGLGNNYPIALLIHCNFFKLCCDGEKRSKILQRIGNAPTLETVDFLEKMRDARKKRMEEKAAEKKIMQEKTIEGEVVEEKTIEGEAVMKKKINEIHVKIVKNLNENGVDNNKMDNFIIDNTELFIYYHPREQTIDNLYSAISAFIHNTRDGYEEKDDLFIDHVKDKETNNRILVNRLSKGNIDYTFGQNFRRKWNIEMVDPENDSLSKYCGELPLTQDYIRKILYLIHHKKNHAEKKKVEVVAETPTQLIQDAHVSLEIIQTEIRSGIKSINDENRNNIESLGKIIEKQNEITEKFINQLIKINSRVTNLKNDNG